MKHTLGPWYAVNYSGYHIIQPSPQYGDKVDLLDEEECDEAEANARLIAAAPELLKALTELTDNFEEAGELMMSPKGIKKLRDLISRATQEETTGKE